MNEFKDKVAVITGGASGIGRGIAERCAQENMKIVLADVEEPALLQAKKELQTMGADVLAVQVDVSKIANIEALAQETVETFGAVHLLFNNAGVAAGGTIWDSTLEDWQWVMGVNLWAIIYGIRVFVPIMLAQDTQCHIINTASIAGFMPHHPSATYQVTKHAVVALSEHLYYSLAEANAKIKTSVLCPGWVNTRILDSGRNRPSKLQNKENHEPMTPEQKAVIEWMQEAVQTGMSPLQVADLVFNAIKTEQFYIFTDTEINPILRQRMENILQQRNPTLGSDS